MKKHLNGSQSASAMGAMKSTRRGLGLIGLASLLFFAGCWWPEKFDATLEINSDKTYVFRFDGTLAFLPAVAGVQQSGKLDSKTEADLKGMEKELLKEEGFKSCNYSGKGRFHVVFDESGKVDRRVPLLGEGVEILTLTPSAGGVEVSGMSLDGDARSRLKELGLGLDGNVRMVSGLEVTNHNAGSTPMLGGLVGDYRWRLSLDDPAPQVVLSGEPATKPVVSAPVFKVGVLLVGALAVIALVRRNRRAKQQASAAGQPVPRAAFCRACGRELADNLAFCDGCGARVN